MRGTDAKCRHGKRRRRGVLEHAETEERVRRHTGVCVASKAPKQSEVSSRTDAADGERRGGARRDVVTREERIDEGGLIAASIFDAQQPGSRIELGRERFRRDEAARAAAAKEQDATEQPPAPSGKGPELR